MLRDSEMVVKRAGFQSSIILCPYCGQGSDKRLVEETAGVNILAWCRKCKKEFTIDITNGKVKLHR